MGIGDSQRHSTSVSGGGYLEPALAEATEELGPNVGFGVGSAFRTTGHLAAYAGLAPVTRRSGTSTRGEFPARGGNKHLNRALFLSAFAALRADPLRRTY